MKIKGRRVKILALLTILVTVIAVSFMVLNLYESAKLPDVSSGQSIDKSIPEMFSRQDYEETLAKLKELYSSSSPHGRNIFTKPKAEKPVVAEKPGREKVSFNEQMSINERLQVVKIYKKPVELLFKGYLQLGDGSYIATINWGGKTNFKKVGDELRGYKMMDFYKDIKEKSTLWGGKEKVDLSTITLARAKGEKFKLQIGKITLEKEIFAEIDDLKEQTSYEVHIGSEILGYKVVDISPAKVIIESPKGEKFALER